MLYAFFFAHDPIILLKFSVFSTLYAEICIQHLLFWKKNCIFVDELNYGDIATIR